MILLLSTQIVERLIEALKECGKREIGGVLMGEHVGVDTFRVCEFTIQMKGGTFATFVRFVDDIVGPLRLFFRATKHEYTRFNYIGEWHSHHSFELSPSPSDHRTMLDIVMDPDVGARFAVLLLVKLDKLQNLEHSLTVYRANASLSLGDIVIE